MLLFFTVTQTVVAENHLHLARIFPFRAGLPHVNGKKSQAYLGELEFQSSANFRNTNASRISIFWKLMEFGNISAIIFWVPLLFTQTPSNLDQSGKRPHLGSLEALSGFRRSS